MVLDDTRYVCVMQDVSQSGVAFAWPTRLAPPQPHTHLAKLIVRFDDHESQAAMKKIFKILYRSDLNTKQALERIRAEIPQTPEVIDVLGFVEASERGITK